VQRELSLAEASMSTSNELKELTPRHRRIAFYIARGVDIDSVARRFGYAPGSIIRFMNDPLFKAEVERLQKAIEERSIAVLDDALIPLRNNLRMFSDVVVAIVKDPDASNNAKLKAIDLGFSLVKPSKDKDEKSRTSIPGLSITIRKEDEPKLKLVEGGNS
jgi:hypothetical protein